MQLIQPWLWSVPILRVDRLSKMDFLLLMAVIGSVVLDILTNISAYAGVQNPVVGLLKGCILVLIVANYRTLYSWVITLLFAGIFFIREFLIVISLNESYLIEDAVFFLRIFFFIGWLLLFYERRNRKDFLNCVLYVGVVTVTASVASQLFGAILHIDFFKAYGDQRGGYKGLFYAENDTSVFYLLALIYGMYLWSRGRKAFTGVVLLGLFFLGLGSKTALLGAIIVPMIYFYFSHDFSFPLNIKNFSLRPRPLLYISAFFILALCILYFINFYLGDFLVLFNYEQVLRVYEQSGLLSSLLSYRDVKAALYFNNLHYLGDLIFGLQIKEQIDIFGIETPGSFMYEIDVFDYLGRVGLLGLILTLITIYRNSNLRRWKEVSPELKTLIFSIILLGLTVGHTLVSSMNGVWLGFWLVILGQLRWQAQDKLGN